MDCMDTRVAIVTGGARGIGAAITTTLARAIGASGRNTVHGKPPVAPACCCCVAARATIQPAGSGEVVMRPWLRRD
jgi:NAD(P)-dependent dehydrogenase (short-subunit alcohol dehydrogenase family)